ncbi:hypothetical protein DRH27_05770, partial [Candidatus Falkowbacteria bacterium]
LFFGDRMLDRHVGEKIKQQGIDYLFNKLASTTEGNFFAGHDVVSVNLEGAVTSEGGHYAPQMSYDFAFHPDLILEAKNYGFNFFSLANNHFADQGERGIIETRKNLDDLGVNYTGCQDGIAGECSSKIIEINNKKIGMASFSMVYSRLDDEKISSIISNLASSSDLVIVNIHWGKEYEHNYNTVQQQTAYELIDSGADIIIGHHPHVVQGIEIYNNKFIFYSLGNFVFDQYFSSDTQEGLAVGILLKEASLTCELFPLKSRLSQTELMNKEEIKEFFNKIIRWSELMDEYKEQILNGQIILNN